MTISFRVSSLTYMPANRKLSYRLIQTHMHQFLRLIVVIVALVTSACATMTETFHERSRCKPELVYCGTRTDALYIAAMFAKNAGILRAFGPIALVDLPFSFIADTVLLPYTVYKSASDNTLQSSKP